MSANEDKATRRRMSTERQEECRHFHISPYTLKKTNPKANRRILAYIILVGFEVLTAVVNNSSVFWNITPYRPLKTNRCFGGTYRL
jgi:hypothetical protein